MIKQPTKEQVDLQTLSDIQERDLAWQNEQAKRQHELDLAKLKVRAVENRKVRERVFIALAKLPALIVLSVLIPILVLANKEVPKPLTDFLNL